MNRRVLALSALVLALGLGSPPPLESMPNRLPDAAPAEVGLDAKKLERIDAAVRETIDRGDAPGAVVLVVRQGRVAFRKAYGARAEEPDKVAMKADTLFDLASLTKPIATATSVMILIEQGKLRLSDAVAAHLPAFAQNGKERVTVEHLLLHTSGLTADNPLAHYAGGREKAMERIFALPLEADPGSKLIYSDVGYIVLGELVEKLGGEPLDAFARAHIFQPLGLFDTTFKPSEPLSRRAAPTEARSGVFTPGQVHDPRAFLLGGVAGHAGLFSTADDIAIFAQMIMNGGSYQGVRVLSDAAVARMIEPRPVPSDDPARPARRALGWDVQSGVASSRGDLFPAGGVGHTGFTGTSLWIDPSSRTAVIVLTSRLHPDGKGSVNRLRGQVASIVAGAADRASGAGALTKPTGDPEPTPAAPTPDAQPPSVLTGIDVLERDGFRPLRGRRVGLITNQTGLTRAGRSSIDALHKAEGVTLVALFTPEHGLRGDADDPIGDGRDKKTNLPVFSLYGPRKRPSPAQLSGVDILVFDIQDIGTRFYTYISTLGHAMEAAAEHKRKIVVLDRPNPIGGIAVDGPVLEKGRESFVGYHAIPVRHGMTAGELAMLFNQERGIGADLEVIKLEGWRRGDLFDRTGLLWVNPSPNMRSLTAALLYPGIGLLETTNISVGRGTDRPFQVIGAPWIDGRKLASALNASALPGARFLPIRFTPSASTHAGLASGGVEIIIDDWRAFQPLRTGLEIARTLRRLYPSDWKYAQCQLLLGHQPTLEAIERGDPLDSLLNGWQAGLSAFSDVRARYLLYPL
jgi:uncharacterized protein YbbC (DUF1343 family)/CubicO group peptidase (beta-lactamase class C family)